MLLCMNIISAPSDLNEFQDYICILKHDFSLIVLSETWLCDNGNDFYIMQSYNKDYMYQTD